MNEIERLNLEVLGNPLSDWGIALGIAGVLVLTVGLIKPRLQRQLAALAAHTDTRIDDALLHTVGRTRLLLVSVVALYLGSRYLKLPAKADQVLDWICTVAVFLQAGLWLAALLNFWLSRSHIAMQMSNAPATAGASASSFSLSAVSLMSQMVLWTIIVLLALDNLGVNVTALVAGLGVGGIAVALAVQNILGDLFASLSIVVDKPFVVGDFIIVDTYMGTVEYVGLKTTRIRSLDGEQIVFSNSDLLKARLRNYKRMYERRVQFGFRLPYQTGIAQLEQVPKLVQQIVEQQPLTRFERAHFAKLGESTLEYEVVYWVTDPDYNKYMDIQQTINLTMLRQFEALGVSLAYPTKTLQLQSSALQEGEAGHGDRHERRPLPRKVAAARN